MSSFVITFLVGVCTFLWYRRYRHVASWWKRTPTLRDRAFDLAELVVPSGWRPGQDLNESAGIEVMDLLHSRYAVVISECRDNFDARLELEAYAVSSRDSLLSSVHVLNVRGPEPRKVAGFDAVQFEIKAVHDMTEVWYLHITIMGRRAFHQVIAWAPRSAFNRKAFEELLAGFRERPGPEAQPRNYPDRPDASPRRIGFRAAPLEQSSASAGARRMED
jgi:hypothetical protein